MFNDNYTAQLGNYNTSKDHRSTNSKVTRLLRALAIELKHLPHEKQKRIDYIINDLRDGYEYNWIGAVEYFKDTTI